MTRPTEERRAHERWNLACPVTIVQAGGSFYASGKTLNVSDGGAFVTVPAEDWPDAAEETELTIRLSVPRSTPNTYLLEDFHANARVVRTRPANGEDFAVALEFIQPIPLNLDA